MVKVWCREGNAGHSLTSRGSARKVGLLKSHEPIGERGSLLLAKLHWSSSFGCRARGSNPCDLPTPTSTWCSDVKTKNIHEDMENVHLSYWLIFCEKRKCKSRWKISLASLDIVIVNIEKLLNHFINVIYWRICFTNCCASFYYIKIPSFDFSIFVDSPRKLRCFSQRL